MSIHLREDLVDDLSVAAAGLERLSYNAKGNQYRVNVGPGYSDEAEALLMELFSEARGRHASRLGMSWESRSG